MINKIKRKFLIRLLILIVVCFCFGTGLYLLKNNFLLNNNIDEVEATEIYVNIEFRIECFSLKTNDFVIGNQIIGEDEKHYNPDYTQDDGYNLEENGTASPTATITAECSEELYIDGKDKGDNSGSQSEIIKLNDASTTIQVKARRWSSFNIGTFKIVSISVSSIANSVKNSYCTSEYASGTHFPASYGGGNGTYDIKVGIRYKPKEYSAKFYNGSSLYDTISQKNYAYWDFPTNNPSKTGYTFDAWYQSDSLKLSSTTLVKLLSAPKVYAHWTANKYNVKFNGNGSTGGSMSNQSFTYDQSQKLSANKYSKTGYTFLGWATSANGNVVYKNEQEVLNLTSTNNETITLYAKWEANGYQLIANANGGSMANLSGWSGNSTRLEKTVDYDEAYGTLPTPTRTGYTFDGWYTASSGGNPVSTSTKMTSSSWNEGEKANIYAHWTANSYKITFNQNSGSGGSSSTTVTYDKAMPSITIPKRTGYSFEGYYDSPQTDYGDTGGGTQYYKSDGTSARNWDKATDTTLYARWLPRDDYKVDINILSPTGEQDYKSGTMTQAYGSTIKEGINDQGFDNITYKESWTISKITPTPGYVLTSVSANAGTLVDNGDGTYTFTANFTSDPNGSWDAVITIQMGDTWTNYAEEPTVKRKIEVNGTTVEAREISKPEHLAWISKMLLTTSNGGYYIQTKPIDMSDHYWYPIGANGRAFTGYYNGQGYAIMNVETSPNMVTESGLFGYIQGGTVENVTMLNAKIQGGIDSGGIAGVNNGGVIRNCYVEGDITATNRGVSSTQYSIGGLVGYSTSGQIESSYYEGTISGTGNRYYGLLIGYGENSSIRDSIGKTTGNTAYYNNGVSVESSLYITGANYVTKKYYEGTFANWVITNGQPLPSGLTWIGNAGDKVTNISQITACGYSKV